MSNHTFKVNVDRSNCLGAVSYDKLAITMDLKETIDDFFVKLKVCVLRVVI